MSCAYRSIPPPFHLIIILLVIWTCISINRALLHASTPSDSPIEGRSSIVSNGHVFVDGIDIDVGVLPHPYYVCYMSYGNICFLNFDSPMGIYISSSRSYFVSFPNNSPIYIYAYDFNLGRLVSQSSFHGRVFSNVVSSDSNGDFTKLSSFVCSNFDILLSNSGNSLSSIVWHESDFSPPSPLDAIGGDLLSLRQFGSFFVVIFSLFVIYKFVRVFI